MLLSENYDDIQADHIPPGMHRLSGGVHKNSMGRDTPTDEMDIA
jgi:hypothetical protein